MMLKLTWTFLLIASSLGAGGVITNNQSARSSGSAQSTSTFTDKELQCFADEKVLYTDNKCYTLRQRGPCRDGQWLVYDKPNTTTSGRSNRLRLVCKTRLCVSAVRPVYWVEDGQCHKVSDKATLCQKKGNELKSDSYGEGECTCTKTFARFEPEVLASRNTPAEWEGDCYPLYRRGPCPARKLLVPALLEGFGLVARCFDDYCYRQNNADPEGGYVMRKTDRMCYKLGTIGSPCAADESFNVHPVSNHPECIGRVNSVFSGNDVRCGGVANINTLTGECREEVFFKAQTFGYQVSIIKPPRRPRTRSRK